MSLRNKKLTALQNITHSLQKSIIKKDTIRQFHSQKKHQASFISKLQEKSFKKFQVRKLTQPKFQIQPNQTKRRFKSLRMHTQKIINTSLKKNISPYQRSKTIQLRQTQQKQQRYPFLTKFQKQQIVIYEVYHIGARRISSIKDFTSSTCQAKVAIGDAIAYRYEILSSLGQGSFGQVFKAIDHKKKQMVALKIIRNQPKFNKQAKVQIKILQNVIISNIVQLKHAFFFRGHACLVFQLLHINLYQFLKQTKFRGLQPDIIRKFSIQILQGLSFLNKFKIVHCDLKPENILLKQQKKTGIKLIDVGSGCFQQQQIYTYIQSRYYRAPQVILGIPYTTAIDIWSMGCILVQLFIGYPIFPGQNQPEQIMMIMQVLGLPPLQLLSRGNRSSKFFQGQIPKLKPNSKGKIRRPNSKSIQSILAQCLDLQFVSFVKKFLIWAPQQRITADEALLDPWIIKGLPDQIKKQHIHNIRRQKYL